MRNTLNAAVGLIACLVLTGCMTFVEGKKDTAPNGEGVEYSLPVPILRVTPMADGTIDVQVEMLADPDNTYRLKTKSYLSSYTLDVVRENGMLKSVSLDAKSDGVAEAALNARANFIKAKGEAETKEREAAATAAKEQAKAISDAKMEVVLANAKVTALEANPDADKADIAAAKLAKAVAEAKLAALQTAAADAGKSGFNIAQKVAPTLPANARVSAAPVLFRVVPDPDRNTVRLVAFEGDRFLETSVAAKKPEEPAKVPPLELKLTDDGNLTKGTKPLVLHLVANKPSLTVDLDKSGVKIQGAGDKLQPYIELATALTDDGTKSKTAFAVTLKKTIPPGSYKLSLRLLKPVVDPKDGPEPMRADDVPFVVNK